MRKFINNALNEAFVVAWDEVADVDYESFRRAFERRPGDSFPMRLSYHDNENLLMLRNYEEAERISRNMFNPFKRQVVNVASKDIEVVELKWPVSNNGGFVDPWFVSPRYMRAEDLKPGPRLDIQLPSGTTEVVVLVGTALEDYKKFQKLQEVNKQITKVSREVTDHERQQERSEQAANKASQELHRLKREQRALAGLPPIGQ